MKLLVFLGLILSSILLSAADLSISIVGQPMVGRTLVAEINSPTDVGVENGLRQRSEVAKGVGKRTFELGTVSAIGIYHFKFIDPSGARIIIVPVLEDAGLASKAPEYSPTIDAAVQKFLELHTKEALLEAWSTWPAREEIARRIVAITAVGTLGLACPFEGLTCGPAAVEGLNLALDFAIAFHEFFAEQCQKKKWITEEELQLINRAFVAAKSAKSALSIRGKWDAAIATVELFSASVENRDIQFSLGLVTDQAKKTRSLLIYFRRPK